MSPRTESTAHTIEHTGLPSFSIVAPDVVPSKETPKELNMGRALVLHEINGSVCVLLLQRAGSSFDADKYELPGGKIDAGETVTESIAREVLEETGLKISLPNQLDMQSTRVMKGGKYDNVPANTYLQVAMTDGYEVTLSDEHSSALWCTKDEVKKMLDDGDLAATSREAITAFITL